MKDTPYTQRLRGALIEGIAQVQHKTQRRRRKVLVAAFALLTVALGISAAVGTGLWRIWPAADDIPPGIEPRAMGPEHVIARGVDEVSTPDGVRAVSWRVTVFRSNSGLCIHVEDQRSRSGGCGFPVPPQAIAVDAATTRDTRGAFVMGPVLGEAVRVEVVLSTGETRAVEPLGRDLGFGVSFFVFRSPEGVSATRVIAYDGQGNRLGAQPVPPR